MLFAFVAVTLYSSAGAADNQVRWNLHAGGADAAVALPTALFKDLPLPIRGARWRCTADKVLRQDAGGNTYSTLSIHCADGETTISSSASCMIGSHESAKLSFELAEKSTALTNAVRAECDG
jgi:hypothetical protein